MFHNRDKQRGSGGLTWPCAIGFSLVLASVPAAGQSTDPFQSAPVAATPPPKPRPQPRPPAEPDPYGTAPPAALAPALPQAPILPPSGAIWARLRQVAQSEGIGVPLASDPPFDTANAAPQFRLLVGAWGPGAWQGSAAGDKLILIILGIDGAANIHGVVARSLGTDWSYFNAAMTGNGFSVRIQTTYAASGLVSSNRSLEDDYWQFELRPDGRLYGSRTTNASNVVLAKLQ
jgi:hypothetical protein